MTGAAPRRYGQIIEKRIHELPEIDFVADLIQEQINSGRKSPTFRLAQIYAVAQPVSDLAEWTTVINQLTSAYENTSKRACNLDLSTSLAKLISDLFRVDLVRIQIAWSPTTRRYPIAIEERFSRYHNTPMVLAAWSARHLDSNLLPLASLPTDITFPNIRREIPIEIRRLVGRQPGIFNAPPVSVCDHRNMHDHPQWMLDVATGLHQAAVMSSRESAHVYELFENSWLKRYGVPYRVKYQRADEKDVKDLIVPLLHALNSSTFTHGGILTDDHALATSPDQAMIKAEVIRNEAIKALADLNEDFKAIKDATVSSVFEDETGPPPQEEPHPQDVLDKPDMQAMWITEEGVEMFPEGFDGSVPIGYGPKRQVFANAYRMKPEDESDTSAEFEGEIKAKARVVALGHCDPDIFKITRELPTPGRIAEHLAYAFIVAGANAEIGNSGKKWNSWLADASTAFLQGQQPDHERPAPLYMILLKASTTNSSGFQSLPELAHENAELVASVLALEELQLLTLEVVVFAVVERNVQRWIIMQDIPVNKDSVLLTYTDSSWANAERSTSQIGVLVTLTVPDIAEKEGKVSIMDWRSCRIPRVCHSTLAAEAVAADEGADRSSFVNMCLSQILHNIPAHRAGCRMNFLQATDAKSLYDCISSDAPSTTDKRSLVSIRAVQETVVAKQCHWVPTGYMHADGLTKADVNLRLTMREWLNNPTERDVPFYVLRAANGNPKTALGRWMETLRWRCEIGDEAIVSKPNPNFFKIHRDYPTYLHLPDQAGRLTYWQMAGQLNPAGLSEQGMTPDLVRDDYVWQTLFTYDLWLQRDGEQEITIIIDMEGFQLSSVTPSMLQIFSKSYSVIQKHFPDREHLVVVINAPEWWGAIWQLFKPLIPQRQREKLRVHTTPFNSEDLLDVIDAKNIPEKYGGSSVPLGEAPAELKRRKFAAEGAACHDKPEKGDKPGKGDKEPLCFFFALAKLEEAAKKEQAAKKGSGEKDAPALLVASDDASDEAQEEQSLRAVSSAEESEAKAKSRAEDALGRLHEASAQGVIGEVSDWSTVEELASSTTEKDASSWEHALEERTQMLEKFNSKPRKNLLDFNASRAVELVYAVQTASAHVELNIRRRQEKMKSAFKDAKYAAMRKVKAMEFDTRDAARNWKALGKKAVKAQRAAHISENVYERHEDLMRDAAGDVSNRAENRADRLKDQVSDYFSRVEDDLHRSSFDKRGRDLMKRAKEAVAQMHEAAGFRPRTVPGLSFQERGAPTIPSRYRLSLDIDLPGALRYCVSEWEEAF
ncbi:unnamed protein product [Effrenium voratum]|nr:unnamed protein product [Effrenium voratum]